MYSLAFFGVGSFWLSLTLLSLQISRLIITIILRAILSRLKSFNPCQCRDAQKVEVAFSPSPLML